MLWLAKYLAVACLFWAVYLTLRNVRWRVLGWKPALHGWGEKIRKLRLRTLGPSRQAWLAGALGAAAAGMMIVAGWPWGEQYWLVPVLGGVGALAPRVMAKVAERRQQRRLLDQFLQVLELAGNALRAGLSLVQVLELAAAQFGPPMQTQLAAVLRDIRLGLAPEIALEKWRKRWPHPDLELFSLAAGVCLRTGGNLAELTTRIAETIGERGRMQERMVTLTAQAKMSGWIVGLMPLLLLGVLWAVDPGMMAEFFAHPAGWTVVGAGAAMELLGALWIRRIITMNHQQG